MKNNRGITMISLVLTIVVMAILGSAMIYYSQNQLAIRRIDAMYSDIQILNAKVDEYYIKYGELPLLCKFENGYGYRDFADYLDTRAEEEGIDNFSSRVNPNDVQNEYWVIDVEKLEGISLNYGYDEDYNYVKNNKNTVEIDEAHNRDYTKNDVYVINTMTHQIYYPYGVVDNGGFYYAFDVDTNKLQ